MSELRGLVKDYGDFKLSIEAVYFADRGVTALCGPSGSGKTSLLRHLIGLETVKGMSWIFNGLDLATLSPAERHLGVVFQTYDLFPHMSGRENVEFALRARGLSFNESTSILLDLRQCLQLDHFWERSATQLSGGEAQRIALARALVARPRMVLLDEPFSSLDEDIKSEARKALLKVLNRLQVPALLISHDLHDKKLADQVIEMREGRVISSTPISDVLKE